MSAPVTPRSFRMTEECEQNLAFITEKLREQQQADRLTMTDAVRYALQITADTIRREGQLPPINGGSRGSFKVGGR